MCKEPLILDFEKEGDMDVPRLRELFLKEISNYHWEKIWKFKKI